MNLTGTMLGNGVATSGTGRAVVYLLVEPTKCNENLLILGRESKRWKKTYERFRQLYLQRSLAEEVSKRSRFADETLALACEKMRLGESGILISQVEDGNIIGVMTFGYPSATEGAISLLAVDPENLTGTPGTEQLRGIGTAMIACISRIFLGKGVTTLYIHPLDEAAAIFWGRRGFGVCGSGGLMCIRDREKIKALIDGCEIAPDFPDRDFLYCGVSATVERMRIPE